MRASSSSSSSLTSCWLSQYWPLDGESRQPIRFISVDLPDPDGPMMATYSLRCNAQVDAAQRMHLLLGTHVVGLPQVLG